MKTTMLVSATLAATVALTLFDATPADAAVQRRAVTVRKVPSRSVQPRVHKPTAKITKGTSTTFVKKGTSSAFIKKGTSSTFVKKTTIGTGTLNLRSLPLHKAAPGNQFLKGRLALPQNIKPKLTLTKTPALKFHPRFAPFVQRHWKKHSSGSPSPASAT